MVDGHKADGDTKGASRRAIGAIEWIDEFEEGTMEHDCSPVLRYASARLGDTHADISPTDGIDRWPNLRFRCWLHHHSGDKSRDGTCEFEAIGVAATKWIAEALLLHMELFGGPQEEDLERDAEGQDTVA